MPDFAPGSEDLGRTVERLADRLRTVAETRLARPPRGDGDPSQAGRTSLADRAHRLAQSLADAEQGIAERAAEQAPRWRTVPRLGDLAVGDQVAVTGKDLAAACVGLGTDEPVWTRTGPAAASAVLARALADVRELARLV